MLAISQSPADTSKGSIHALEQQTSPSPSPLQIKVSRTGLPLVPQPSDDPFDPLNFSRWRKFMILVVLFVWSGVGCIHQVPVAPALAIIADEFNISLQEATYLVGAPLLAYGVASLIWVAVGNRFGVRITFLVTSFLAGIFCVWAALAQSAASLIAARTLVAVVGASPETLGPQAIGDVFFLPDRATCMSLIVLSQAGSFPLGSLVGAYITQERGWRWIEWAVAILAFGACLLVFVFFPETQYTRASTEKHQREATWADNFRVWPVSGGGRAKVDSFWKAFTYPFRYLPHPAVVILTIYFSIMLVATSFFLTTNPFIYSGIYGFNMEHVGLTSLAPLIAVFFAIPYCGVINDRFVQRLRKRTDFIPEWRLGFFFPIAILSPIGSIIIGVCADKKTHWIVPLIGEALVMFGFVSANSITQTYLVDIYEARADATLVIQNGFKNLATFGVSYAVVPWTHDKGYSEPFGTLGALMFAAHIPLFVLWWKGRQIREWSGKIWKEAQPSHHGDSF